MRRSLFLDTGPVPLARAAIVGASIVASSLVLAALVAAATKAAGSPPPPADPAPPVAEVATAAVVAQRGPGRASYDGVVEAVRQTVVAAQVPGAVVALQVRAGDRVQAGQVLMRIDARAAEQAAAAGAAQVGAARAALDVAAREFERQRQLFAQGFISQAALDLAEARYKTTQAETSAQLANAGAARTQSDLHVVKAPYEGIVAAVSVVLGDMAMPGRPLLTLYDPSALRVTAAIPQTALSHRPPGPIAAEAELPGTATGRVKPLQVQLLPTVDAASHTVELRLDLPRLAAAAPGMFARVWLPGADGEAAAPESRLFVPAEALVRRPELAAVYVIGPGGRPTLRQVRPGRRDGTEVEILSGVAAGERVALDPQAAARIR